VLIVISNSWAIAKGKQTARGGSFARHTALANEPVGKIFVPKNIKLMTVD